MRPTLWIAIVMALVPLACGYQKPNGEVSFTTVDADPDWSPDGRMIAFASSRWLGGLCVIQPDGKGLRQLFRGVASNVDWSPDGRRIAFQGDHGIYVIRRRGGPPTRILDGGSFSIPTWAPDGRTLAVVKEERDLTTAIYVVGIDGSGVRRLLPRSVPKVTSTSTAVAASETEPAWSPDGRRIAFQAGDGRIAVATLEDGRRRIIAIGGYEPAWSPDGRLIAFQAESALWVTNADGSGQRRLLASNGGDPSWAPDSLSLVFEARHWYGRYWRRPQSLSLVDSAGTNLQELTFGGSVLDDPAWRGDKAVP
jgi:TolB protein